MGRGRRLRIFRGGVCRPAWIASSQRWVRLGLVHEENGLIHLHFGQAGEAGGEIFYGDHVVDPAGPRCRRGPGWRRR